MMMEAGSFSIASGKNGSEIDNFVEDIEKIKEYMQTMEKLSRRLQEYNEDSKNILDAATMKEHRGIMESEIDQVLILSKAILKRLEDIQRFNSVQRKLSAPMSSTVERTRMSVMAGVGKKLREMMAEFQGLRVKMAATYKETVERKFLLLTGEKDYIENIENLISNGEIEKLLVEAIEEKGRYPAVNILEEIHERREGAKYMQMHLVDLQQQFVDMVSVIEANASKLSHAQVLQITHGADSFNKPKAAQLHDSWDDERGAKKRGTIALIFIVIVIVILIVPLFQFENDDGKE